MMQLLRPSLMATLLLLLFSAQTIMATKEKPPKWKISLISKISGPSADKVWPLVANFCDLYKIFPTDLTYCVKGVPSKPGQIRYSASKTPSPSNANTTVVVWAEEELLAIDQTKRYVTYGVLRNNRGITKFLGTMQILPIDNHSCKFKWLIAADPVAGTTYEAFLAQITSVRDQTVEKIENLFGAN